VAGAAVVAGGAEGGAPDASAGGDPPRRQHSEAPREPLGWIQVRNGVAQRNQKFYGGAVDCRCAISMTKPSADA